jgi:hypothetical protein
VIYLASPYAHVLERVREQRFVQARVAVKRMMRQGMYVYSPIVYGHQFATMFEGVDTRWAYWKTFDLQMLAKCDRVIVLTLDGWKDSCGVTAEVTMAKELGIPVEYMSLESIIDPPKEDVA